MHFLVLGPLEVRTAAGEALTVRAGRARSLLHSLLLGRRVVQPVETIVDRLWAEDAPVDAANAVHQLVSYLRRALGPEARGALLTTTSGYRLDVPDHAVDAWEMEHLLRSASSGLSAVDVEGTEAALRSAVSAVQLWRGEPFSESANFEWTTGDRARLQDVYLQAQETRVDLLLKLGRHREANLEAQSLSAAYPLREKFHAQSALALYRSGRQSEALEVHRAVRELLARDLGLDPGNELKELERAILNQHPSLDWQPLRGSAGPRNSSSAKLSRAPELEEVEPPAPRSPPIASSTMFGRERDLQLAVEGLHVGTVYTLTGPAGVGKTRLALDVSRQTDRPTWFVDLAGLDDAADVPAAVAATLGIANEGKSSPADVLVEALSSAKGVLLLDNGDEVVSGVADLLSRLVVHSPDLAILVTSRRPLGVRFEVVHRLNPLPVPPEEEQSAASIGGSPAVQLWIERARSLDHNLKFDAGAMIDIAHIVRRVDGLPMAIELAAGHADVSTTRTIRERLESRLDSLVSASFPRGRRSQSLTAAIDASVAVLRPEEREFLLSLSVFPAAFDSYAAAAVAGIDEDTAFRCLASLVRQSLVAMDQPYRLLTPVRSFASNHAASELDLTVLRRRHAAWISTLAWDSWQRTGGLRHTQDLRALTPLMADARVALEWALSQEDVTTASRLAVGFSWVWTLHGRTDEGFTWLSEVRALSDRLPAQGPDEATVRATVLRSLGLLANPRGELTLARDACSEATALSLRHGDRQGAAAALLTLTVTHWALGDFEASAQCAAQASDLLPDRSSWYYLTAKVLAARTALDAQAPHAADLIEAAVDVAQESGDAHMLGLALACQARQALLRADLEQAMVAAEEALRIWRDIAYTEGEIMALNLLSRIGSRKGDYPTATSLATTALGVAARTGHRGGLCEATESLALAAAAEGRRERALHLLLVSQRERARLGAPVPAADARGLEVALREVSDAIGEAGAMVRARARLTRLDDLVSELTP